MKKVFSLFLISLLVVSSFVAMPFVANAETTDTLFGYYTGGSGAPAMGTLKGKNMTLNSDVNGFPGMSSVFGKQAPQKLMSDGVYHYSHSATKTSPNGAPRIAPFVSNPIPSGNAEGYEYLIYDFDVLFATEMSSLTILVKGNTEKCNVYGALIAATEDASNALLNQYGTLSDVPYGTAIYNRLGTDVWHRVRIAFPINGQIAGEAFTTISIDGVPRVEQKVRSAQYNVDKSAYIGLASSTTNGFIFLNAEGNTTDVYLDNIKIFGGSNDPEAYTAPSIVSIADAEIEGEEVIINSQMKVGVLKKNAVLGENVSIAGVYGNDLATPKADTEIIEDGDTLVIRALDDYALAYNIANNAKLNSAGIFKYIPISVQIPTFAIESISVTPDMDAKTVDVEYNYENGFEENKNITILLAVYDENGKLLEAKVQTVAIPNGIDCDQKQFTVSDATAQNAKKVKAFAVKSIATLAPCCDNAEEILD